MRYVKWNTKLNTPIISSVPLNFKLKRGKTIASFFLFQSSSFYFHSMILAIIYMASISLLWRAAPPHKDFRWRLSVSPRIISCLGLKSHKSIKVVKMLTEMAIYRMEILQNRFNFWCELWCFPECFDLILHSDTVCQSRHSWDGGTMCIFSWVGSK